MTEKKRKNLSNLYEIILDEKGKGKAIDKQKDILELKELTTTPSKEKYNDMAHYHVLMANFLEQADLLFLPTATYGYKYLLVVVDANH